MTNNDIYKFYLDWNQIIGSFFGAFFAFIFFLVGNWIKQKIDWGKAVKTEHAYLERNFSDVQQVIEYNKGLLPKIINDFENKNINFMDFVLLPIHEYSTLKMKDKIFINKVELFITELKGLNLSLSNINRWKAKISDELLDDSDRVRARGAASLVNFLTQMRDYKKVFEYHLDQIDELMAENRILLKRYKNLKYDKEKIEKENTKRKNQIDSEKKLVKTEGLSGPIMDDHIEKLKKFGLHSKTDDKNDKS